MSKLAKKQLQEQIRELTQGSEAIYRPEELAQRLHQAAKESRPLRVKLGLDPTAPDIHLGHTVQLARIRKFQDIGHKAVLIIGDYTARIGDPSGTDRTRPILSPEEIQENAKTYIEQAGKVLDTSAEKLEIRYNSEWLSRIDLADILRLSSQMTVAQVMERDTFQRRYKAGAPIGVHEFLYPLMQGYDSVCIQADVEIGGTDQTFNNLVGRRLQENAGQLPQIVMIFPLLVGLDGQQKMSKSKRNYIGITDEPNNMYGKVMSIPDKLMENYFSLLTELPQAQIKALTDPSTTHPRQAKADLARRIVSRYHGAPAADAAAAEFDRVFSDRDTPSEMQEIHLPAGPIGIIELIMKAAFARSTSEARRLVRQDAVSLDGRKISSVEAQIEPTDGAVLRVGKRRFGRLVLGQLQRRPR